MPLDPGDEIVSAVSFNGYVLVFTRQGVVWQVTSDPLTTIAFQKLVKP